MIATIYDMHHILTQAIRVGGHQPNSVTQPNERTYQCLKDTFAYIFCHTNIFFGLPLAKKYSCTLLYLQDNHSFSLNKMPITFRMLIYISFPALHYIVNHINAHI